MCGDSIKALLLVPIKSMARLHFVGWEGTVLLSTHLNIIHPDIPEVENGQSQIQSWTGLLYNISMNSVRQ